MAISYLTAVRNGMLDNVTAAIDAGPAAGLLNLYDGAVPPDANAGTGGSTLLAQLTMGDPSAAAAAGGVWTANSITQDPSAAASGVTTYFRIVDSTSTVVLQGTCGESGSGADLIFDTTTIAAGQPVSVTSLTITEGNP